MYVRFFFFLILLTGCSSQSKPEPKVESPHTEYKTITKTIERVVERPIVKVIEKQPTRSPTMSSSDLKKYEGRVTDAKDHRTFTVTCEARDVYHAKQILESQHKPNRVDFVHEINK